MRLRNIFLSFLFQKLRVWKYNCLSDIKEIYGSPELRQPVLFTGKGKIFIGKDVVFGVKQSQYYYSNYSYIEARSCLSKIIIGDRLWANNNLEIICNGSKVEIQNDVLIGASVSIYDSDFHVVSPCERRSKVCDSVAVCIESGVWLGSNVKVLKGVTIGMNTIIACNSVVTKSIPSNVIAGGVPATVIRGI